ncbi:ABC transporter substrate-binding protein [Marivita sp. GX14005]|uniref:ABC transporter substrate-binding protein n=1 Tax=Marivita sp. GX14005 TaxID=2942276 RepID=UPI002019BEC0|nr:ABC transporter substrate-binding protein [Marivita sp. GX14005]MCL3883042.1 ABC transporter substrate-binding protein [Marivita sp. GX14005]
MTVPLHPTHPTRRAILAGAAASAAALACPLPLRAQGGIAALDFYGPPAGPSITLAHAVATGRFDDLAQAASMTAWRSPDELRAGLTSGSIQLSIVPVQAAANLYNRGFPIRLANVMTDGLLYIASSDAEIGSIGDLKGRGLAVPFRGDTPEILFAQLLAHHGIAGDPDITYAATPVEAMQLLLAGRVEAALTTEPSTSAAVAMGRTAGKDIRRVVDLQTAWGEMTGAAPVLPQAGLAVAGDFLTAHDDAVPAILSALDAANADVLADPEAAARHASAALDMPAPLLAASITHSNLVARPASEARGDIERMLTAMTGPDMGAINGKLPDDGFYL